MSTDRPPTGHITGGGVRTDHDATGSVHRAATEPAPSTDPSNELAVTLAPTLAVLAALHDDPHITRVAQRLQTPQPTVSRRLAAAAADLGAPLTESAGRGIRLTRAGRLLTSAALDAQTVLDAGVRRAQEEIHPDRGHVVLGFLHLLGRSLVPGLLKSFRADHPGVRFSLVQGSRQHILDRLDDGGIDLALTAPPPDAHPDLAGETVAEQELLLCVPAGRPWARRRSVSIAELAEEEFVMLEHGYGLRQITDDLCAAAGFTPQIAFEGQESDTVRGLVAAGLGVALLPRFEPGPPAGVAEIPLTPPVTRRIGLAWRRDRARTPAVETFRRHILDATAAG